MRIGTNMFCDDGRPVVSVTARNLMGRITSWREGNDFGFIAVCDGDDVFVHEAALPEIIRNTEERVGFLVQFDLVTRETFDRVAGVGFGQSRKESARNVKLLDEPQSIGRLSWKGTFGFISCADGKECFCSTKNFLKSGLSLDTGDVVQFIKGPAQSNGARPCAWRISPSQASLATVEEEVKERKIVQRALDGRIVKLGKNFGFIRPSKDECDIYFRINEQTGVFRVGDEVVYSVQDAGGWLSAFDVVWISRPQKDARSQMGTQRPPTAQQSESKKSTSRMTGLVTSWNEAKGYGFITPDKDDGEVFVHSADAGTLKRGTRVTFSIVRTLKGTKAIDIAGVSHMRTICRNPACRGAHFLDNCPLNNTARKVADSDYAASEGTCSTAATLAPCPSRRVLPKSLQA